MIPCVPTITEHAYRRADERLGLAREPFAAWVKATYPEWLLVNADFLYARGVKASAYGARFYVTPWSAARGVALVVSDDHSIKTVMDFHQEAVSLTRAAPPAADASQPPDDPMQAAALRLVQEDPCLPYEIVSRRAQVGHAAFSGATAGVALADFAAGRINAIDLGEILRAGEGRRGRILADALARTAAGIHPTLKLKLERSFR